MVSVSVFVVGLRQQAIALGRKASVTEKSIVDMCRDATRNSVQPGRMEEERNVVASRYC